MPCVCLCVYRVMLCVCVRVCVVSYGDAKLNQLHPKFLRNFIAHKPNLTLWLTTWRVLQLSRVFCLLSVHEMHELWDKYEQIYRNPLVEIGLNCPQMTNPPLTRDNLLLPWFLVLQVSLVVSITTLTSTVFYNSLDEKRCFYPPAIALVLPLKLKGSDVHRLRFTLRYLSSI